MTDNKSSYKSSPESDSDSRPGLRLLGGGLGFFIGCVILGALAFMFPSKESFFIGAGIVFPLLGGVIGERITVRYFLGYRH